MFRLIKLAAIGALGYCIYECIADGRRQKVQKQKARQIAMPPRPVVRIRIAADAEKRQSVVVWNASNEPTPRPQGRQAAMLHH